MRRVKNKIDESLLNNHKISQILEHRMFAVHVISNNKYRHYNVKRCVDVKVLWATHYDINKMKTI